MNSSLVSINILVKSNVGEKYPIIFSMNVSSQSLRDYLRLSNIYCGTSTKNKIDLVEMIIYGCIRKKIKMKYVTYQLIKQRQYSMRIIYQLNLYLDMETQE